MAKPPLRNFVLVNGSKEVGLFTGRSPRQAALKAANRGFTNFALRERGTEKLHLFTGGRRKVQAPAKRPAWLPAEIWRPWVKKRGIKKPGK